MKYQLTKIKFTIKKFFIVILYLIFIQPNITVANPYYLGEVEDLNTPTRIAPKVCPNGIACKPSDGISLPSEKDWSNFVTPVKNQGQCGSCVVFATTAALESALLKQNKGAYDISEQYGLSCLLPPTLCDSGMQIGDYVNLLKSSGSSQELSQYPYTASYGSCDATRQFINAYNFSYNITAFQKVSITSIDDLKSTLVQYGPIVASFKVYSSFFNYSTGLYRPSVVENYEGGHAVLVVGYSDKMGGFRVKNSWGTGWGDNGFFWIAYDQIKGMSAFGTRGDGVYAVTDTSMPPPQPEPTPQQINAALTAITNLLLDDDESSACAYTLTTDTKSIPALGGTYQAAIKTGGTNCEWDLSSDKSWLIFSSTPSGKGNSTIGFSVDANTTYLKRTDTITLTSPTDVTVSKTLLIDQAAKEGISVANASVKEGAVGQTKNMAFTIQLSKASTKTVTVNYTTQNGTAIAPSDYIARSGKLSFLPGETVKKLAVKVIGDKTPETNETFSLVLSTPTVPYALQVSKATGTILNDD